MTADKYARLKAKHAAFKARRGVPASVAAPAAPVLRLLPCVDLGERVPGQPCGSPLLKCNRHGDITARFTSCSGAQRTCATCADYQAGSAPAPLIGKGTTSL